MSENLAETFLKGRTLKDAPGPYFGQYGGRWMPESLIAAMDELEQTFNVSASFSRVCKPAFTAD